jgi:hypothetical protein
VSTLMLYLTGESTSILYLFSSNAFTSFMIFNFFISLINSDDLRSSSSDIAIFLDEDLLYRPDSRWFILSFALYFMPKLIWSRLIFNAGNLILCYFKPSILIFGTFRAVLPVAFPELTPDSDFPRFVSLVIRGNNYVAVCYFSI